MPLQISKERNHAIIVGVGQRDEDASSMEISVNDAHKVAKELVSRCHFKKENTQCLTDKDATLENFIAKLEELAHFTIEDPTDLVVIYFSGHGVEIDGRYYLVCRDSKNNDLFNTGLEGTVFVNKLRTIQTKNMVIFLDCCHSTGVIKSVDIPFNKDRVLDMPNRAVITASHASQVSYLSKPVSIFTYALIEGLAGKYFKDGDKDVTLFDLAMYIRERVFPLSNSQQQPQLNILQNGQTTNFTLTRYPNGEPSPAFENEPFTLLDFDGKEINTGVPHIKDDKYRQQFMWLNMITIEGDKNIIVQNANGTSIVINQDSTSEHLKHALDIITRQMGQLDEVLNVLNNQNKPLITSLADRLRKLDLLETVLIQKQNLVFVGRTEFKAPFYRMLNKETKQIMVLEALPKAGLSYIRFYLGDVADEYDSFDFYYLNIQEIAKSYPDEILSAAHICEIIASKIGLDFDIREFKLQPYVNRIINKLNSIAKGNTNNKKCLLYIDQFDILIGEEFKDLIKCLVTAIAVENAQFYILLGGFKYFKEWPDDIKSMATSISIESSFNKDHVNNFLEKAYSILRIKDRFDINRNTFFASAYAVLPEKLFDQLGTHNIETVGARLTSWYKEIKKRL